jgi:hypothetical protein
MTEANLNPYQSPQGIEQLANKLDSPEQLSLAELQARVLQLERRLNESWFFGPLWKRSLAVFLHWIVGYGVIFIVIGGTMMLIGLAISAIIDGLRLAP